METNKEMVESNASPRFAPRPFCKWQLVLELTHKQIFLKMLLLIQVLFLNCVKFSPYRCHEMILKPEAIALGLEYSCSLLSVS